MNMIIVFIIIIAVLAIIGFIVKEFAKLALVAMAIVILFGAGFVWGPKDLNEKLGLSELLTEDSSREVNTFATEFDKKREENKIVDTQHIADKTNETGENVMTKAKDKVVELFH